MLRIGIIGTNFISEWFAQACQASGGRARAVGVCSRTPDRARAFADQIGAEFAVTELDQLAEQVDAIYIATPILTHHPQAMAAIAAGKHVLVEKTMGASAAQVAEILTAAEQAGVVAMEAVRNVHTPTHQLIRETLTRLGTIRQVHFEKLQYSSRYDKFRAGEQLNAFDPALANSALADIGVYCLQPAIDLFGEPARSSGASIWLANGFEGGGSMQLDYGSALVDVVYSKITAGVGPNVINGEDAALVIDDLAEPTRMEIRHRGGFSEVLFDSPGTKPADTMVSEVLDFVDQVEAGAVDPRWSQLSLISRRLMDEQLARRP